MIKPLLGNEDKLIRVQAGILISSFVDVIKMKNSFTLFDQLIQEMKTNSGLFAEGVSSCLNKVLEDHQDDLSLLELTEFSFLLLFFYIRCSFLSLFSLNSILFSYYQLLTFFTSSPYSLPHNPAN